MSCERDTWQGTIHEAALLTTGKGVDVILWLPKRWNSARNHKSLEKGLELQKGRSLGDTLIAA